MAAAHAQQSLTYALNPPRPLSTVDWDAQKLKFKELTPGIPPAGINVPEQDEIRIYASEGFIHTVTPQSGPQLVSLYDLSGHTIFSETSSESHFSTAGIPAGIYIVQVEYEGRHCIKKLFLDN